MRTFSSACTICSSSSESVGVDLIFASSRRGSSVPTREEFAERGTCRERFRFCRQEFILFFDILQLLVERGELLRGHIFDLRLVVNEKSGFS
jgi:hypothetical protein